MKQELERQLEASFGQLFKYLGLDVLVAIGLWNIHEIQMMIIGVPILICSVVSTYHWMDQISYLHIQQKELEEVTE